MKYKWLSWNKDYPNKIDKESSNSSNDINEFILLLRKDVHAYEYMNNWEKINEPSLPEKEEFYSNLNMKDITNSDYNHAKRICNYFTIKKLCEYHDLHIKSDTLRLANVSENFRKMCLEIYELHPAKCLSAQISLASNFKEEWSKIRINNWYWHAINGWKRN